MLRTELVRPVPILQGFTGKGRQAEGGVCHCSVPPPDIPAAVHTIGKAYLALPGRPKLWWDDVQCEAFQRELGKGTGCPLHQHMLVPGKIQVNTCLHRMLEAVLCPRRTSHRNTQAGHPFQQCHQGRVMHSR